MRALPGARGEGQFMRRERSILAAASAQHGVLSAKQLRKLGFDDHDISRRVRLHRLRRVHAGVFMTGAGKLDLPAGAMAAVLAVGLDSVASYRTAAELWGLRDWHSSRPEVTAPTRGRRCHPGIVVHTTRNFWPESHTKLGPIPITSPSQTLLDLADVVNSSELKRCFSQAGRLGLLDVVELEVLNGVSRGRRGRRSFAWALATHLPIEGRTRSNLEVAFLSICLEASIPLPAVNARLGGDEVDFTWRDRTLAVETDGGDFHRTREDRENDIRKDERLQLAGYRVIRFSEARIENDRSGVISTLRRLFAD